MREIKYRAWHKRLKVMVPVQGLAYDEDEDELMVQHPDHDIHAVIGGALSNYEVMQYTGLKDKNGVEIYEGDIVRHGAEDALEVVRFGHAHITTGLRGRSFDYVGFYLEIADSGSVEHWGIGYTTKHGEVIGNIHDNPELLESSS